MPSLTHQLERQGRVGDARRRIERQIQHQAVVGDGMLDPDHARGRT
jgi:hypothetical protein